MLQRPVSNSMAAVELTPAGLQERLEESRRTYKLNVGYGTWLPQFYTHVYTSSSMRTYKPQHVHLNKVQALAAHNSK